MNAFFCIICLRINTHINVSVHVSIKSVVVLNSDLNSSCLFNLTGFASNRAGPSVDFKTTDHLKLTLTG